MRRVVLLTNVDVEPAPDDPERELWDLWSQVTPAACAALRTGGADVESLEVSGADLIDVAARLLEHRPDAVFNFCESLGADSRGEMALPCLLDVLGVPYTGSGPLALGLALHKDKAKALMSARGVPTPPYAVVETIAQLDDDAVTALGFPLIVKPAREDGSLGVGFDSVVTDAAALADAVTVVLAAHAQPALVEEYIDGRELSVPILGNDPHVALPVLETIFDDSFAGKALIASYGAKWDPKSPQFIETVPCELDTPTHEAVTTAALEAFAALGCRDYGRVDLRLSADGVPYVIDVNPNCDLQPGYDFVASAEAAGISYADLLARLVDMAVEREQ